MRRCFSASLFLACLSLAGCSGQDSTGGTLGQGGSVVADGGASTNTGGHAGTTGGAAASGGTQGNSTGGAAAGASSQGGLNTGGSSAAGGTDASTGGSARTGGTAATGGAGAGGTPPTGGSKSSGGASATGGVTSTNVTPTGGVPSTGGSKAGGGTSAATGGAATGGVAPTGGSKSSGGAPTTGGAPASGGASTGGTSSASHWVVTWTGAPQLTEQANLPPASLTNSALRQVVHVSLGGSRIRLRFSNEFGNGSLTINAAHVAVCRANPVNSTIDTTTDKALAFSGAAAVTIPQGQAVWSDALDFSLAAMSNLSVTVAFGNTPSNVTGHPGSRTTSYEQTNSTNVTAANMTSAQTADHWYVLSGLDVMADAASHAIVVLGDSITDGRGSTTNGNDRWPDDLAKRLAANSPTANVAIANQGIGGNAVVSGGLGPTAVDRFSRDVLGQSGVRWLVILEGVNDIGAGTAAAPITSAFDSFISQAHAQNILVYGATILPFGKNSYYTAAHESARQSVNTYIKSGKFDGYIDFDAAMTDSANPPNLQAAYDSGDGLHPSAAGYQHMASIVDLSLFTK